MDTGYSLQPYCKALLLKKALACVIKCGEVQLVPNWLMLMMLEGILQFQREKVVININQLQTLLPTTVNLPARYNDVIVALML